MKRVVTVASLGALLATTSVRAQSNAPAEIARQPVAFVERPLTLPRLTLSPELDATWQRMGPDLSLDMTNPSQALSFALGASFGILDSLQVSAVLVPLTVYPNASYGSAQLGAMFRLIGGARSIFELALAASLGMAVPAGTPAPTILPAAPSASAALGFPPAGGGSDWVIGLGVPVRLHFIGRLRIDSGVYFPFDIQTNNFWNVSFTVPISLYLQLVDWLFLGVETGVTLRSLRQDVAFNTYLPLAFDVGFTIPGRRGPAGDVLLSFTFPQFLQPGGTTVVDTNLMAAMLSLRLYFYFGS
jgi:hypothetical protein